MNDKKVIVLLSSYNGEKYIEEQLESILNQTYKNIEIIVRDDGSTDNTLEILKKYEKQKNIYLEHGNNLGFLKSFYWLLENTKEADYYSFADQDDFWLENKIEKAVNTLNNMDQGKAALYFCDYDYYDKEMNFISHKKPFNTELTLQNSLVSFICSGFTCVINNELKRLFLQMPSEKLFMHDYFLLLLGISFGNVFYDKNVYAKFRRHGKNSSFFSGNIIKTYFWRIKKFLLQDEFEFKKKWKVFFDVYRNEFNERDKKILKLFANEKYRFDYALRKAFYKKRYRTSFFDELTLRFIFLIGKI